MSRKRPLSEGSYQHLDGAVVACLQGRRDIDTSVQTILGSHPPDQIKAILLNEGERYRRVNHARFADLVGQLRLRGVLW